ncbi:peptidoglycan DD-metalloendopeptidase family protein [Rhodopirellula sp. JC639]|uniref:peptidoglycan DD-metalloendopeptidase family protein n=1 Tax=Stieleria mannarensis TaxID=2755585 RepID=UPI001601DB96|nr:peptidoglycan DD-metalloendopeptidase family protein [Rhodopirellula sp. JC639]
MHPHDRRPERRFPSRWIERLETRSLLSADLGAPVGDFAPGFGSEHSHDEPAWSGDVLSGDGDVHTVYQQNPPPGPAWLANSSSPNLRLIAGYVRDGQGNPIESPFLGQRLAIQVQFETTNLPFGAAHAFHFTVDGVTLGSGVLNTGAGQSAYTGFRWRAGWFATPGTHQVVVTADAFNTVAESDETDNSISFTFTTGQTTFAQPLIWPVEGTPFVDHAFLNYVDVDPTGGIEDFRGGGYAYDGHSAWDIAVRGYDEQDAGIEIYAAADGTVVDTHDGEFDRQTNLGSTFPPVNYVVVDHGDGWTTRYVHLRRDSVQVSVGDVVSAGDKLGYMASSGWSDITHLHFALEHYGFSVEPWYDPSTFLHGSVAALEYIGESQAVLSNGISNVPVAAHVREGTSQINVFEQKPGQLVYTWNWFSGVEQGDEIHLDWRRPDGSVFRVNHVTAGNDWAHQWRWYSYFLPDQPDLGTWTIDVLVNGVKLAEQSFVVASQGVPEARVLQNGALIVDDRVTPIDFGTIPQSSFPPSRSFVLENHGEAVLNLGDVAVPSGFTVTDPLPASLAPGQSDTLTVQLSTMVPGQFAGQVRIETDDADEGVYEFSVEGIVTSTTAPQQLILGLSERKTPEGTTLIGNVRRSDDGAGTSGPLVVNLASDSSRVTIPASVTIPAGSDRVLFRIQTAVDSSSSSDDVVQFSATSAVTPAAQNELLLVDLPVAPTVVDVDVNGGDPSRSSLESITVRFDQQVAIDLSGPETAVEVVNRDSGAAVPIDLAASVADDGSVLEITFPSPTELADGNYLLILNAPLITASGLPLDGNGNGIADSEDDYLFGNQSTDAFFRFYGDTDGDRDVDGQDYGRFGRSFLKSVGQEGFDARLDSDFDGDVDGQDYGRFGIRFLRTLPE